MVLSINENNAASILLQNLQLQHRLHHKLRHQQLTNLLEFQPELLAQDKTHLIHNRAQIHLQIVI